MVPCSEQTNRPPPDYLQADTIPAALQTRIAAGHATKASLLSQQCLLSSQGSSTAGATWAPTEHPSLLLDGSQHPGEACHLTHPTPVLHEVCNMSVRHGWLMIHVICITLHGCRHILFNLVICQLISNIFPLGFNQILISAFVISSPVRQVIIVLKADYKQKPE